MALGTGVFNPAKSQMSVLGESTCRVVASDLLRQKRWAFTGLGEPAICTLLSRSSNVFIILFSLALPQQLEWLCSDFTLLLRSITHKHEHQNPNSLNTWGTDKLCLFPSLWGILICKLISADVNDFCLLTSVTARFLGRKIILLVIAQFNLSILF